ncbi:hypothetical protein NQU59_13045 [Acinetobacter colistiniresistens]|nr:hypothetical protein NQU59_13045 [Acinetobacter colistiniresistens]
MAEIVSQTKSATSPTSNKTGTHLEIPLQDTIPVIFVPGIMGSNIFNTALKKPVWKLGNGGGMVGIQQIKQQESIYEWQSLLDKNESQIWTPKESFPPINKQEIEHLKKFNFPVYAMGYNWLQSSEDGKITANTRL